MQVILFAGKGPRKSGKHGFTLIELLVVVAILAILAAILFPVYSKAQSQAKTTQCLSNLRQLGMAVNAYLGDSSGYMPPAAGWGSPNYWKVRGQGMVTIQEALMPYVQNGMVKDPAKPYQYQSAGVFACPSDTGISDSISGAYGVNSGQPVWRSTGCSYEWYAGNQIDREKYPVINPSAPPPAEAWTALSPQIETPEGQIIRLGAPISNIAKPSAKAIMGDIGPWHMGDVVPVNQLAFRNTLYLDAHVARARGLEHCDARIVKFSRWHPSTLVEIPEPPR